MKSLTDCLINTNRLPSECAIKQEILDQIKKKEFVIFGTGRACYYALGELKKRGIVPDFICDSFEHKTEDKIDDISVVNADMLFKDKNDYLVLVCCLPEYGIAEKFSEKRIKAYQWDTHAIDNFSYEATFFDDIQKNRIKIDEVYGFLADERSRHVYKSVFEYRLYLDCDLIKQVKDESIYFDNDVVERVSVDAFIDCGAYVGDTLKAFVESDNCICKYYYALEPNQEERIKLEEFCAEKDVESVVNVMPYAAWKEDTCLCFLDTSGGLGMVSDDGRETIKAVKLDSLLPAERKVGFIKMDIEGSEIEAIRGAEEIIKRDHPILAISVYHHRADLWEIPLLIKRLVPQYSIYIRHYSNNMDDTVCYAVL